MSMSIESRARQLFALVEPALDEEMTDIIGGDIAEGLWAEAIDFSEEAARIYGIPLPDALSSAA